MPAKSAIRRIAGAVLALLFALGGTPAHACVPPIAYIFFPPGGSDVAEVHHSIIETLVLAPWREMPSTRAGFAITGYADSPGDEAYNLDLSRHRAEAVRQYLLSAGVPADRITLAWYGETRLWVDTGASEPNNRVVTVEFSDPDHPWGCP